MSDLHLEVGDQYDSFHIPVEALSLILAGDIGRLQDYEKYLSFISTQCKNFDMVYLVLGNHEFYGLSRDEGLTLANNLEKDVKIQGRLRVLNRRRVDIEPSISILGCTLHSHIRPENRAETERRLKDFRRIIGWTVDQHNSEHEEDLNWLRAEINSIQAGTKGQGRAQTILVITHHAPVRDGSSHPGQLKNPWTDAFATELIGMHEDFAKVQWWVFGHTHYNNQWRLQGIRMVSNQRGYVTILDKKQQSTLVSACKSPWRLLADSTKREGRRFEPRKCINIRV